MKTEAQRAFGGGGARKFRLTWSSVDRLAFRTGLPARECGRVLTLMLRAGPEIFAYFRILWHHASLKSGRCLMTDLDPNAFGGHLNATLGRFVATSSPINEIRAAQLATGLRDRIGRLPFVKGPFVEMLPDFEKGESLEAMHGRGLLDPAWSAFAAKAPAVWRRPLHVHQHTALTRSENYLVATGTGSGKTESFLYPLVDDILRQGDLDRARRARDPGLSAERARQRPAESDRGAALSRPRRPRHHDRALYRPGEGARHSRRGDDPVALFARASSTSSARMPRSPAAGFCRERRCAPPHRTS